MFKVKNTNMHAMYCPFHSTMSRSWVARLFRKEVHQMTLNYLDGMLVFWPWLNDLKVKNTNMHATYTPEAEIFIGFALWWAVFPLRPSFSEKCTEWPQMTFVMGSYSILCTAYPCLLHRLVLITCIVFGWSYCTLDSQNTLVFGEWTEVSWVRRQAR